MPPCPIVKVGQYSGTISTMDLGTVVVPVVVALVGAAGVIVAAIVGRPAPTQPNSSGQTQTAVGNNNVQNQNHTTINQTVNQGTANNSTDDPCGLIIGVGLCCVIGVAALAWAWKFVGPFMWILPVILFFGSIFVFWQSRGRTSTTRIIKILLTISSGIFAVVAVLALYTFADGYPGVEPLISPSPEEFSESIDRLGLTSIFAYALRTIGVAALILGQWHLVIRRNQPVSKIVKLSVALILAGFLAGTPLGQQACISFMQWLFGVISSIS